MPGGVGYRNGDPTRAPRRWSRVAATACGSKGRRLPTEYRGVGQSTASVWNTGSPGPRANDVPLAVGVVGLLANGLGGWAKGGMRGDLGAM